MTIRYAVKNPGAGDVDLLVEVQESDKLPDRFGIGSVESGSRVSLPAVVPRGAEVKLLGMLGSYQIFESASLRATEDKSVPVTIVSQGRQYDEHAAFTQLKRSENRLRGLKSTRGHPPLLNFLNANFGGFWIERDGSWDSLAGPSSYSGGTKDLNWISNNTGDAEDRISDSVVLNRSVTAQVAGGFSIFVAEANYTSSDFYRYSFSLEIFSYDHDMTGYQALIALKTGNAALFDVVMAAIQDPSLRVVFLRRIHVVKNARIDYEKASKQEVGSTIGAGSYLSAGVAYRFDGTNKMGRSTKDYVLGAWYEPIALKQKIVYNAVVLGELVRRQYDVQLTEEEIAGLQSRYFTAAFTQQSLEDAAAYLSERHPELAAKNLVSTLSLRDGVLHYSVFARSTIEPIAELTGSLPAGG